MLRKSSQKRRVSTRDSLPNDDFVSLSSVSLGVLPLEKGHVEKPKETKEKGVEMRKSQLRSDQITRDGEYTRASEADPDERKDDGVAGLVPRGICHEEKNVR
jgi:hypothetical protein